MSIGEPTWKGLEGADDATFGSGPSGLIEGMKIARAAQGAGAFTGRSRSS